MKDQFVWLGNLVAKVYFKLKKYILPHVEITILNSNHMQYKKLKNYNRSLKKNKKNYTVEYCLYCL